MNTQQHAPVTQTAFFRFYEELNDFLPAEQCKIIFPYEFRGKPSIKNTIEAIGVPHSEIEVILVDGKSVGFDYLIRGGEMISVYPVFESFDVAPLILVRPEPLRKTKFILDVNLGKLARKLRLLGFDSLFSNNFSDKEIVKLSSQQQRIILTRDKGILKYSTVTHGYWVRNEKPAEQLRETVKRLQLENNFKPFTRCSNCNQRLLSVDKKRFAPLLEN